MAGQKSCIFPGNLGAMAGSSRSGCQSSDTPLHWAACGKNNFRYMEENLIIAIKSYVSANEAADEVLKWPQPQILEWLISKEDDINVRGIIGDTPLHVAISTANDDCALVLMKYIDRIDINALNDSRRTPLHYALQGKRHVALHFLLKFESVDYTSKDASGTTVLHEAAEAGNELAVDTILSKAPRNIHMRDTDSTAHPSAGGTTNDMRTQFQRYVDTQNSKGQTAVFLAVSSCHYNIVESLVKAGADVNMADEEGTTCLHMSLQKETQDDLKRKPLHHFRTSDINMIALELCKYTEEGVRGLTLACFLASRGGDLHKRDKKGRTPLDITETGALRNVFLNWLDRNSISYSVPTTASATAGTTGSATPVADTCRSCLGPAANVKFEPCGHRVYCSECSSRMKRCQVCNLLITWKAESGSRRRPPEGDVGPAGERDQMQPGTSREAQRTSGTCLGQVGRVNKVNSKDVLKVRFPGERSWILSSSENSSSDSDSDDNTGDLTGRLMRNISGKKSKKPSRFSTGDLVKISSDAAMVKRRQRGHGGYNSDIASCLGRIGEITKVDSDGDVRVNCIGQPAVILNPDCVRLVDTASGMSSESECDGPSKKKLRRLVQAAVDSKFKQLSRFSAGRK